MTKKEKSSKQKRKQYEPVIYMTPFLDIVYGLYPNRESLDKILSVSNIPVYTIDHEVIGYAATIRGEYHSEQNGRIRYAFVYAESMLNDNRTDDARKLSYLAHEAYHIVSFMFNMMNEEKPSEEAFAYALTDVVNDLFDEYYKWKEANSG